MQYIPSWKLCLLSRMTLSERRVSLGSVSPHSSFSLMIGLYFSGHIVDTALLSSCGISSYTRERRWLVYLLISAAGSPRGCKHFRLFNLQISCQIMRWKHQRRSGKQRIRFWSHFSVKAATLVNLDKTVFWHITRHIYILSQRLSTTQNATQRCWSCDSNKNEQICSKQQWHCTDLTIINADQSGWHPVENWESELVFHHTQQHQFNDSLSGFMCVWF